MQIDDIQVLENRLAGWAAQIKDLESQIPTADSKLRETYLSEVRALERKRLHAEEQLAKFRIAKAESYAKEDLQAAVMSVFDDIGRRLDHLITRQST